MFPQTINGNPTAEQKVSSLTRQAMLNVSQSFARLSIISDDYSLDLENEVIFDKYREYIIAILYTINENLTVINFLGARELLDAFFLNNLDARDWYDKAIEHIHKELMEDEYIKENMKILEEMIQRLHPKQEPLPDELGDDEALTSEEREALNGQAA